jgi:hypothetical protein
MGGTEQLSWHGEGNPDFGSPNNMSNIAVFHAAHDILKCSKFHETKHEIGLLKLVVQKAIAEAKYYEKTVPEFTKALANVTSAPGQKGITVELNRRLVNAFEKNALTPDWFNNIASKHYDHDILGGNSLALGARALSIAATNIDPKFKTTDTYASSISSMVNSVKPRKPREFK